MPLVGGFGCLERKARNAPSRGHFVPKPLIGGFGCLELVLYGIRVLEKQFLESNIDIRWRRLILTVTSIHAQSGCIPREVKSRI